MIQTRLLISPPSRNVIPLVVSTNRLNTRAMMTPMIAITLNSAFKNVPAPLRMIPAISTISSFPSFIFFTLLKLKRTKTRATTTTANTAYQITELSISSTPIKYICKLPPHPVTIAQIALYFFTNKGSFHPCKSPLFS